MNSTEDKYNATYNWKLRDLYKNVGYKKSGTTVFTCFHCGGGSTMGYKLAGCEIVGGVEIDPQMMKVYRANHHPPEETSFLMPIQDLIKSPELLARIPRSLDILDGSPPCSTFSTAGDREKKWGKEVHFREGQAAQVLDTLFFDFIQLAKLTQPKIVIAENVKGMLLGSARGYIKDIQKHFTAAGYTLQLFLLNAASMGVPQARQRVFFVAQRNDLPTKPLVLHFNEAPITAGKALEGASTLGAKTPSQYARTYWEKTKVGESFENAFAAVTGKTGRFSDYRLSPFLTSQTITSHAGVNLYHWDEYRYLSTNELSRLQTFPSDYDYCEADPAYMMGMSVPPLMTQRVAVEVQEQLLGKTLTQAKGEK